MRRVVLHPCAAVPERVRVWLGVFEQNVTPPLTWRFDGKPAEPIVVRPIASVRTPAQIVSPELPRAFSGVFEFEVTPAERPAPHRVEVSVEGETAVLDARAVPSDIPAGLEDPLNVLLVSCYHWAEDRTGLAAHLAASLPRALRPHLTVMMGDQVYLDLPTTQDFPDDERWLAHKFEEDYARNWRNPEGFAEVLDVAPIVTVPDDHEFWNNFPEQSPFIQNTSTPQGRANWRAAALSTLEGFQNFEAGPFPSHRRLELGALSIFITEMRVHRTSASDGGKRRLMTVDAHAALAAWVNELEPGKVGMFVSGQSMFTSPVSDSTGRMADWELPNYDDYPQTFAALDSAVRRGCRVLCVTGDVHWGRVSEFTPADALGSTGALFEVISSPSSLVTTIGLDTVSEVSVASSGSVNPWRRHSMPPLTPTRFRPFDLPRSYNGRTLHRQQGNQTCLLSFRKDGAGAEVTARYFPLLRNVDPVTVKPFTLLSR